MWGPQLRMHASNATMANDVHVIPAKLLFSAPMFELAS
jgi:hypothetical protein